jgi:tRNA threonylcarbamoyl adenosine modification protein (Sua5/YciO/YrdC/YwlC family)
MTTDLQLLAVSLEAAAEQLLTGKVGVIPTDTLYGLVACATDPAAVTKLYAIKRRDHKPGTVIAASTDQLLALGVHADHIARVKGVWPGSVSVETPLGPELAYLHQDTGRQGFRVVAEPALRALLERTGPLVTSSANQPGEPVAAIVGQAHASFGENVDFYVDGGDLSDRLPSTLIAVSGAGEITIIREGAVKAADLRLES